MLCLCPRTCHELNTLKPQVFWICWFLTLELAMEENQLPLLHQDEQDLSTVSDGSLDFRSQPAIRARTGRWRASVFVIGYELVERLAYYGISSSLVLYMINDLHFGSAKAAIEVNIWSGTSTVLPIFGAFIADAYWGRYWTTVYLSGVYVLGAALLTLSASISVLKPASCSTTSTCEDATPFQLAVFFISLYLVAIGTGGVKPCLEAFGADQFDEEDPEENKMKSSFFNWWYFGICIGCLLAFTVIVYIEDNVSYGLGFGVIAVLIAIAILVFLLGTPLYRNKLPNKSPLIGVVQVCVAAAHKWHVTVPEDDSLLFEVKDVDSGHTGRRKLLHTEGLRCLDKAATIDSLDNILLEHGNIIRDEGQTSIDHSLLEVQFRNIDKSRNPWELCTVTQVEEVKLILRIIPLWLTSIIYGLVIAQGTTFFVEQAATLDRSVWSLFTIPSGSLLTFSAIAVLVVLPFYEWAFVPIARWCTGQGRGLTLLQRLGIGLFLSIVFMVVAGLVEMKRLSVAAEYGLLDDPSATLPMSVAWLIPQYLILGVSDVFALVGQQEFFYDQVPDTMRSLGMSLYLCAAGFGSYLSSVVISIVEAVTSRGGSEGWIIDSNINRSHLDYFYWLLAVVCTLNFIVFLALSWSYTYKAVVVHKSVGT